jgi:hypothetical protein
MCLSFLISTGCWVNHYRTDLLLYYAFCDVVLVSGIIDVFMYLSTIVPGTIERLILVRVHGSTRQMCKILAIFYTCCSSTRIVEHDVDFSIGQPKAPLLVV